MPHQMLFTLGDRTHRRHFRGAVSQALTSAELQRYSRHLLIPSVGEQGQLRLKNASVLIVGCGALASPAAMYLAAAGVGRLGLVDDDVVDLSNLQRQILHGGSWVGQSKLESATHRLREVNPHVNVERHPVRFTPDNAMTIASAYDIIVDGSDNFATRFLTNDTSYFLRKPLVHGAIHRFEGQLAVFAPQLGGPCYRCMLPDSPAPGSVPSCAEAGVLGVLPGIIGSMQAMETLKLILGIGNTPLGKLIVYDALASRFRTLTLHRDPACRLCGDQPDIHSVSNTQTRAQHACTATAQPMQTITASDLRNLLSQDFQGLLIDVREPHEHAMAHIPQARLIPLGTLMDHVDALPTDRDIYIHCKMGMRSARACEMLMSRGLTRVANVTGGIDAWLAEEPA
jgi:sulfur-carrier protein adenylyltransferase/sulfurtransferase